MAKNYEFHVISNTHWDREWRFPYQETRTHLVELIDWLLELMENNPDYKHFHLDSQTIPIEDYLEIRPENKDRLKNLISDGRLLIGPWYTLPEMNTISAESIVRNLMMGHKVASEFGKVMKVGYTPTSYGQQSQMAQIYSSFGIDGMMFYRGINRRECDTEYILESPDGSQILGLRLSSKFSRAAFYLHLSRSTMFNDPNYEGYYQWKLGKNPFRRCDTQAGDLDYRMLESNSLENYNTSLLDEGMKNIKEDIAKDATTPFLVALDGMDSIFPHPNTVKVINYCNEKNSGDVYIHASFTEVIEKIRNSVDWSKLTVLKGERRHPSKDDWFNRLLKDGMSTRLPQRQQNARIQTLLEKWAEPFSTFTFLLGEEYPEKYLEIAWKHLLANHPHDSINGVSMDRIHEDMQFRFSQTEQVGEELTNRSFGFLAKKIDFSDFDIDDVGIVAFNPLNYSRTEVVEVEVDFPDEPKNKSMEIIDADTKETVPFHLLERKEWGVNVMDYFDIPAPFFTQRFKFQFLAKDIPANGYRSFIVRSKDNELANYGSMLVDNYTMENDILRIEFNPNGTFNLIHKQTGQVYYNCHFFEDDADAGDPWTRIEPLQNSTFSSLGNSAKISLVENSKLQTTMKVELEILVPEKLVENKNKRSKEKVKLPICSLISLKKDNPRIEITTTFDNQAMDHRLRVYFPSGVNSPTVDVETAYDVVTREIEVPDHRNWVESSTGTQPHLSFFDVSDEDSGLAVISHGLTEYEVKDNESRTMVLTLIKGIRYPKVGLPPDRVERLDQIGSQCFGKHTFSYALYPHEGNWETGKVYDNSYKHFTPIKLIQCGISKGSLAKSNQFFKIEPEDLVLSAVKKCDSRDSVILRFFNPTEKDLDGKIKFWQPIKQAWLTNLNEERQEKIQANSNGELSLKVEHKKIITLELTF